MGELQYASEHPDIAAIESTLISGDLSKLTPAQRVAYYNRVCESLGLNPLTKPFAYLKLNGNEVLYALRDAAEQLRKIHGVSITEIQSQHIGDVFVVTAKACDKTGRTDASTGAVPIGNLKGETLANALMKAETKAKRRVTLSICGLGMLDETEVESIPQAGGYTVTAPAQLPPAVEDTRTTEPPPTALAESVQDGALRILNVEVRATKNKNIQKFVVVLSDGREVSTINPQMGVLAESICQEGTPVTVETKTTKWGEDLIALHRASPQGEPRDDAPAGPPLDDAPPFTDSDIAF